MDWDIEYSIQLDCYSKITFHRQGCPRKFKPKVKHPYKLHVCVGISKWGASPIVLFDGIMSEKFYTEEIPEKTLLPFIRAVFPDGHRFQQDNDPKHISKVAEVSTAGNGINCFKVNG